MEVRLTTFKVRYGDLAFARRAVPRNVARTLYTPTGILGRRTVALAPFKADRAVYFLP